MWNLGHRIHLITFHEVLIYNLVLLAGFIWFCKKYKRQEFPFLIILLFFSGMISDVGGKNILDIYRMVTLVWSLMLFVKHYSKEMILSYLLPVTFFTLYSFYFVFISIFYHHDNILLVFAQLSKYLIPFFMFFIMMNYMKTRRNVVILYNLFGYLIVAQILFSVAKLFILGNWYEGLVGSMSGIMGGGAGTSFPLLGLCWFALRSKMEIKGYKSVLFITGLLFIGFMTGKRAVWGLFPVLFILLSMYVYRRNYTKQVVTALILVPFFIYCGLRLMPSLNPDNKIWGKFDPEFAWNYSVKYSTGIGGENNKLEAGKGRVGAVKLVWDKMTDVGNYTKQVAYGSGNAYMAYASRDDYHNADYYQGVSYRGGITGIVYTFFVSGIFGVAFFLLFILTLFLKHKGNRIIYVLFGITIFDYVFYNACILVMPCMFTLTLFMMLFAQRQQHSISFLSLRQIWRINKNESTPKSANMVIFDNSCEK